MIRLLRPACWPGHADHDTGPLGNGVSKAGNTQGTRGEGPLLDSGARRLQKTQRASQDGKSQCTRAERGGCCAPSPGTVLGILALSSQSFELRKHLSFILRYFAYTLTRFVLRYQECLREVQFGVWKHSKRFLYN